MRIRKKKKKNKKSKKKNIFSGYVRAKTSVSLNKRKLKKSLSPVLITFKNKKDGK